MTSLSNRLDLIAVAEGGPMFMGRPDRWWDKPHWRCGNDHVSTRYLGSEEKGGLCLAGSCRLPVHLTFPEDIDGPLVAEPLALKGLPVHTCQPADGFRIPCLCIRGQDHDESQFDIPVDAAATRGEHPPTASSSGSDTP